MTVHRPSLAQLLGTFAAAPGAVPEAAIDIAESQLRRSIEASAEGSSAPQAVVVSRAWATDAGGHGAFHLAVSAFSHSTEPADPVGRTIRTVTVPALRASAPDDAGRVELLATLAVAAEITCRLYTALEPALSARRTPVHTVLGPLGAAIAVARANGGGAVQITNALAVAGSLACGVGEIAATDSGAYLAGWAAQSGLLAGRLGIDGFSGPVEALEGQRGLFTAFADGWDGATAPVAQGLGENWLVLDLGRPGTTAPRRAHRP